MLSFGKKDKLQIIAFRTYGTPSHLYVRGRALEDEEIDLSQKGIFQLLQNTWKRFGTDEIRNSRVRITLPDGKEVQGTTDNEGYYLLARPISGLSSLTDSEGWLKYHISYADTHLRREIRHQNRFPGEVLIPAPGADFGVISDIDDTILHTGVVSSLKWQVILNTVFKRATSRKPLEGTSRFYHLLHGGKSGKKANPIFYVSHSPWNLYRYLELFLKTNDFPKGPIVLRSIRHFTSLGSNSQKPEKQKEIINILRMYPHLKFILIGDSGEKDADIYIEISKAFPDRILTIYLRSVNDKKRMDRVKELMQGFRATPFLLVNKTDEAVKHARKMGFIP